MYLSIYTRVSQSCSSRATVLQVLDVSLLKHTWFIDRLVLTSVSR